MTNNSIKRFIPHMSLCNFEIDIQKTQCITVPWDIREALELGHKIIAVIEGKEYEIKMERWHEEDFGRIVMEGCVFIEL